MSGITKKDVQIKDKKYFSILLSIVPLLDVYEIPFFPISYGEVMLILYICYSLICYRKIILNRSYTNFFMYALISSLLISSISGHLNLWDWSVQWARFFIYTFLFTTIAIQMIDMESLGKSFQVVGMITAVIQLFQWGIAVLMGRVLLFIIPGSKLHYTISDYNQYVTHLLRWNGSYWRPSNFFLEPAAYAQYALIVLVICLIVPKQPKIKMSIFITIAIIVSQSAIGVIMSFTIWVLWSTRVYKYHSLKYYLMVIILGGVAIAFFYTDNTFIQGVIERVKTIGQLGSTTGNLRVLRGWVIYLELPFFMKIFGVGMGTLGQYLIEHNIVTRFDAGLAVGNEYMNTVLRILVNTGIVGMGLFVVFVSSIYRRCRRYSQKVILFIWLILCSVTSNFLNIMYVLPLILIMSLDYAIGEEYVDN